MRTINYLINVYSITFWGLYYWLVHSFLFFWVHYWQCMRLCPFGGGELGPHLTQCGQGRGLFACKVSSWYIHPFGRSTLTSQTTDRQWCDSIGRTVLRTVAQIFWDYRFLILLNGAELFFVSRSPVVIFGWFMANQIFWLIFVKQFLRWNFSVAVPSHDMQWVSGWIQDENPACSSPGCL